MSLPPCPSTVTHRRRAHPVGASRRRRRRPTRGLRRSHRRQLDVGTTASTNPVEDTSKPPFQDRHAVPVVSVNVGDVNRPEDGVLSCPIPAGQPPVSHWKVGCSWRPAPPPGGGIGQSENFSSTAWDQLRRIAAGIVSNLPAITASPSAAALRRDEASAAPAPAAPTAPRRRSLPRRLTAISETEGSSGVRSPCPPRASARGFSSTSIRFDGRSLCARRSASSARPVMERGLCSGPGRPASPVISWLQSQTEALLASLRTPIRTSRRAFSCPDRQGV